MVKVFRTIGEMKNIARDWARSGFSIGFVPTMGCLHAGHASLIKKSVSQNDKTVVSIFVNPTQFGPEEDLDKYPRDFDSDLELCKNIGVDVIFFPEPITMYSDNYNTYVNVRQLTDNLCGKRRKNHFEGVCTVLTKLFNIVKPDCAYFGKKDVQQLCVVKRMVEDLNFDLKIIGCDIVRESDGLAMSSRNKYLSADEREAALCLNKSLNLAKKFISAGKTDVNMIRSEMIEFISKQPLAKVDYVEIVDGCSLKPINFITKPCLIAIAVYIGKTRLIDNFYYE